MFNLLLVDATLVGVGTSSLAAGQLEPLVEQRTLVAHGPVYLVLDDDPQASQKLRGLGADERMGTHPSVELLQAVGAECCFLGHVSASSGELASASRLKPLR